MALRRATLEPFDQRHARPLRIPHPAVQRALRRDGVRGLGLPRALEELVPGGGAVSPPDIAGAGLRKLYADYQGAYIRRVSPEKYRNFLVPDSEVGCKRRVMDTDYLECLNRDNVEERVVARAVAREAHSDDHRVACMRNSRSDLLRVVVISRLFQISQRQKVTLVMTIFQATLLVKLHLINHLQIWGLMLRTMKEISYMESKISVRCTAGRSSWSHSSPRFMNQIIVVSLRIRELLIPRIYGSCKPQKAA